MMSSRHAACRPAQLAGMALAVVASVFLSVSGAQAQVGGDSVTGQGTSVMGESVSLELPTPEQLLSVAREGERARSGAAPSSGRRQRSLQRKAVGAAIGAVGGFFAGGFLGAAIEGDRCNCDDPGLQGFIIGAPVGAVTLGILGAMYF